MRLVTACLVLLAALALPSAASAGQVRAGVAVLDGTYHVGSSAGQYASTRDGGYGDGDPHVQSVKNVASYGVQSRLDVRALVVQGAGGKLVAMVTNDHYIPQDGLRRRTAQLVSEMTGGRINGSNLTLSVSHNHSSPSYSSLTPGVWTFQDVVDVRFFDFYARQNARALKLALDRLHDVRVSATVSRFDAVQRNPMGPGTADDGSPSGYPASFTDHDLSVIRFEDVDGRPKPLATLVNYGQHPEFLEGYDLISGEYVAAMRRFVDRRAGGVTLFTQNATGTSEVEREAYHPIEQRQLFDHAQYAQMEWGAKQLADAVVANVEAIGRQEPDPDDRALLGMASYHDRFVGWMRDFPVAIETRWFGGPVSHPAPSVDNCRTDAGRVPNAADCADSPGSELVGQSPLSPSALKALGIPVPDNVSVPSAGALEDTVSINVQAFRLGDILFTVCACEQWVDQSYNIKTRTDRIVGNEYLGYDPTGPDAEPSNRCVDDPGPTWSCTPGGKVADALVQRLRARVRNDAAGWDDPLCAALGCGLQAESEPPDPARVRGNYTHDDTPAKPHTRAFAAARGYRMVVPIGMANDYNGYIATYRDYMARDHYRKALTGWGPHSSDYLATRLVRLGHALKGDPAARRAIDAEADPVKAAPEHAVLASKVAADQLKEDAEVRAIGEAATAAVAAYAPTVPDDGGSATALTQPQDVERFDAATFAWDGGNVYTDNPVVAVERREDGEWVRFADQSGEVPTTVRYPASAGAGQRWRWTATFEAFVSRFDLVDPQGRDYRATPAGEYRFVATGRWRKGGADVRYERTSRTFTVAPWDGITVEDVALDQRRRLSFAAGPSRRVEEARVRRTDTKDLGRLPFTIGPVDFPDTARDQTATGARFLDRTRGYSARSPDDAEHYCLDCRFRDWADATGKLTATVTYRLGRRVQSEKLVARDGRFRSERPLARGEAYEIVVRDAWGNTSR